MSAKTNLNKQDNSKSDSLKVKTSSPIFSSLPSITYSLNKNFKTIKTNNPKFFVGLSSLLIFSFLSFFFSAVIFKPQSSKDLEVFLGEGEGDCQVEFILSPSCQTLTLTNLENDQTENLTSSVNSSTPVYIPGQQVQVNLSSSLSSYANITIGSDERLASATDIKSNITNGRQITLPTIPGEYYFATNVFDDDNCNMFCNGDVYTSESASSCQDFDNFIATGHTCENNCKGYFKIESEIPIEPTYSCSSLIVTRLSDSQVLSEDSIVSVGDQLRMQITDSSNVSTKKSFQYLNEEGNWIKIPGTADTTAISATFTVTEDNIIVEAGNPHLRLGVNLFNSDTCAFCGTYNDGYYCPENTNCDSMEIETLGDSCHSKDSSCSNDCGITLNVVSE